MAKYNSAHSLLGEWKNQGMSAAGARPHGIFLDPQAMFLFSLTLPGPSCSNYLVVLNKKNYFFCILRCYHGRKHRKIYKILKKKTGQGLTIIQIYVFY